VLFVHPQVTGFPPGIKVVQTACGRAHSVALLADGTVYSWGDDRNLQLGVRDDSIK
jgi:alpha-tubulin suppressor-like RCC1 family protein